MTSQRIKIAGVQMDVAFADRQTNLRHMVERLNETAEHGATLTVFPECTLSGYCFGSLGEAKPHAEVIPGPATELLTEACQRTGQHCVFGMLESDGERIFNAAVLLGPTGILGTYRKVHLPFLGVDRFTTPGDRPFTVHSVAGMKIGMNICYDGAFPEAARILALAGADLIVLPTNWPRGAECSARCVINTRALENHVYYMSVNRVGTERGFSFIGQSKICDPHGQELAVADERAEAILYAEIDPQHARNKHLVRVPGQYELDRWLDRRPEMYTPLTRPVK
jgi:predicted amidohydrolase